MTLSKQALGKQLTGRESWCGTMERYGALFQGQMTNQLAPQPPSRRESLRRGSLQPGVPRAATKIPNPVPDHPALENVLRRIGVSPEYVLRPCAEGGGAHGLNEKRVHMAETLTNVGCAVESPLRAYLAPLDNASRLLLSSLLASSQYETSLCDGGQEEALSGLEVQLASLHKGLQGLNTSVLHRRDRSLEKFLERWG